jgi:hypothetical protein
VTPEKTYALGTIGVSNQVPLSRSSAIDSNANNTSSLFSFTR